MNVRKNTWKNHMQKLMNAESQRGGCVEHARVEGPVSVIKLEEVDIVLKHMKSGKASGPTGVVMEMLSAGGKDYLESLKRIFNEVLFENKTSGI